MRNVSNKCLRVTHSINYFQNMQQKSFSDIDCGRPPSPIPHSVETVDGTNYENTARYTCVPGYQFKSGATVATISCNDREKWTSTTERCEGSLFLHPYSLFTSSLPPSLPSSIPPSLPSFLPPPSVPLWLAQYCTLAEHFKCLQHSIKWHQ